MRRVPREAKGEAEEHPWKDGRTISFRLRVPFKGRKVRLTLGTNHEGWNRERADVELERILGLIERGNWEPPPRRAESQEGDDAETLRMTATRVYKRKWKEHPAEKTRADLKWRFSYILSHKAGTPTGEIDAAWFDGFRDWLSGVVSEKTGKVLSPRSQNMVLSQLAEVLDEAVRYRLLPGNPARAPRTRVKEKKKRRPILEPDMVVDLLDASGEWEAELRKKKQHHWCYGRRAFLALLILAGPRISEAVAIERASLDIHSERCRVDKSKTEAGERDLDLTAYLVHELRPHLATSPSLMKRAPTPQTAVFHTHKGGPLNPDNFRARALPKIIKRANKKRAAEGKLLIPIDLTPHAFRRTFVRLCFMAGRELDYVMGQIGHKDATLAVEIYAQMRKSRTRRKERELAWKLMHFSDEGETFGEVVSPAPVPVA